MPMTFPLTILLLALFVFLICRIKSKVVSDEIDKSAFFAYSYNITFVNIVLNGNTKVTYSEFQRLITIKGEYINS